MTKKEKLISKILENKPITINEVIKLLTWVGYTDTSTKGSHQSFRKTGRPLITLVLTDKDTSKYIIQDLKNALNLEGYNE